METKIQQNQSTDWNASQKSASNCSFTWTETEEGQVENYSSSLVCESQKKWKREVTASFYTKVWKQKTPKGMTPTPPPFPNPPPFTWTWVQKKTTQYAENKTKEWGVSEDPVVLSGQPIKNKKYTACDGCKCEEAAKQCSDSMKKADEMYDTERQKALTYFSTQKNEAKNKIAESCKKAAELANSSTKNTPTFKNANINKLNQWYDSTTAQDFKPEKTKVSYGSPESEDGGKCTDPASQCGTGTAQYKFSFSASGGGDNNSCDESSANFTQTNGATIGSENFNIYIGL
jgi:hypothetical protein